jgi:hypothetical protein
MNKWELFQKFLITENSQINFTDIIINSLLVIILSLILEFTYTKCARSLSNKKMFASNFLLLTFTTMVIIMVVKSSLALSLGLVGALSIVRFRSAIKEPEELTYLFFAIAIGLALGANQRLLTVVSFIILLLIIWVRYFIIKKDQTQNLFVTVTSSPKSIELSQITEVIKKHFIESELKRFDEDKSFIEASYYINIKKTNHIIDCKSELQKLSPEIKITFIDNKI